MPAAQRSRASSSRDRPPRPANSFILFRSRRCRELREAAGPENAIPEQDLSGIISREWKADAALREFYKGEAAQARAEHAAKYPGYEFKPQNKTQKAEARERKKAEKAAQRKQKKTRGAAAAQEAQVAVEPPMVQFHLPPPVASGLHAGPVDQPAPPPMGHWQWEGAQAQAAGGFDDANIDPQLRNMAPPVTPPLHMEPMFHPSPYPSVPAYYDQPASIPAYYDQPASIPAYYDQRDPLLPENPLPGHEVPQFGGYLPPYPLPSTSSNSSSAAPSTPSDEVDGAVQGACDFNFSWMNGYPYAGPSGSAM